MSVRTQVCRAFHAAVMGTLVLALGNEALHAATHPPQPHTDQNERIEHKMTRLREAEVYRVLPRAVACSGYKPPLLPGDLSHSFAAQGR